MEEQTPKNTETTIPPYLRRPERYEFTTGRRELLFLAGILIFGLALANSCAYGGLNLGVAICAVCCILCSAGYLMASGHKGDWYTRSILGLCLVIAAGFSRAEDQFVEFVMLCFLFVGVNLSLCLAAEQNRYTPGGARSLFDAPVTFFSHGFGKLGPAFRGVAEVFRSGSPLSRKTGAVLLGLAIALPMLLILIPLLMSADAAFEGLIDLLPDLELEELFVTAATGIPLACVLYSRGVSLSRSEKEFFVPNPGKSLNALTMNTALGAVCLVYVAYLLSQIAYFAGGFAGILPQGYTAAEYARRGFFEIAWICGINLGIITFAIAKVQKAETAPLLTRCLCLFLGVVTEFLVCSAFAKMGLYISIYGLTRLRVLTLVILVFLGITTGVVSVWLFLPKLPYMKIVVLTALVLGAAVLWADVDTVVARYNVEAYLCGRMASVDVEHLGNLGTGAIPYLSRLAQEADGAVRQHAQGILDNWHFRIEDFRDWNLADWLANQAGYPRR